jgi:flavin-dependent dehydrogenase
MVAVIGAGPAGCSYASLVRGGDVYVFEEHDDEVGTPVSCAGILTDSGRRVIGDIPEELVVSRIHRFKMVAPSGKSMYVDLDKVNMILDHAAFDRQLLLLMKEARLWKLCFGLPKNRPESLDLIGTVTLFAVTSFSLPNPACAI